MTTKQLQLGKNNNQVSEMIDPDTFQAYGLRKNQIRQHRTEPFEALLRRLAVFFA